MRQRAICVSMLRAVLMSTAASVCVIAPAHAQQTIGSAAPASVQAQPQPGSAQTTPPAPGQQAEGAPANGAAVADSPAQIGGTVDPVAPGQSSVQEAQDIVVTGSRLNVSGYQQPTPVTVVGVEKLQRDAQTDLASVITQLPAVGQSQSPNAGFNTQAISGGTAGLSLINLRNLGVGRTLTLFNGVRVTNSSENGGVDLNLLPASLVQRIDIVTGGASAAWGSDAVSGVINVILNKNFNGFAANFEGASDERGYRQSAKGEVSFGADVLGRGHIILSGSYLYSPDLVIPTETSWFRNQGLVNNPAYTATNGAPRLIHAQNVGLSSATQGGLITSGPLRGIQFVEGGRPAPFNFGNVSGTLSNGGTFANPVYNGQSQNLTVPIKNSQLFGHFAYELTDDITASVELDYGRSYTRNSGPTYTRQGNVSIRADNPFLDPAIAAQMQALGLASFALGTTNSNNLNVRGGDEPYADGLGNWNNEVSRTLFRQVASLEGKFDLLGRWAWNVDLQHSEVHRYTEINGNPIVANYNLAVDAVRVTTANAGTSGLAPGSIACRSTLTNPGNGCVPLNILGINVASRDAINYVQGSGAYSNLYLEQHTASGALRGKPFSTWAGPVAVAFGIDYRKDAIRQDADALSYARAYSIGNFQPLRASQNSIEGFGEVSVPLIKDGIVESLDVSAAGRWTDYSTSGRVVTWKFGATSQIIPDVRVRATLSRDIRAPTLISLFNTGSSQQQVVLDPQRGNAPTNITTIIAGNPALTPEIARTFTAGMVLTPQFLPGLSASVDIYRIRIRDAFATPIADQVLQECAAGNQNFCALIRRDPGTSAITQLIVGPVNAALEGTSGIDFQLDYARPALGGKIDFSVLGNYTSEQFVDALGSVRQPLGSLNRTLEGFPKFRATFGLGYGTDRLGTQIQVRTIGAAQVNKLWSAKDVDDNHVPAIAYVDLRANYYVDSGKRAQIYFAADNVLNQDPPIIPNDPTAAFSYFFVPTRTELYDFLGRTYRVGVRFKF